MAPTDDIAFLVELCQRIPELRTEVRGTGTARFIYARAADRAMELAPDLPGFHFEAWNVSDEESDAPPVVSVHLDSIGEVEARIHQWLAVPETR